MKVFLRLVLKNLCFDEALRAGSGGSELAMHRAPILCFSHSHNPYLPASFASSLSNTK